MRNRMIAKELFAIARILAEDDMADTDAIVSRMARETKIASDPILDSVVNVVQNTSFMSLRRPLERLGIGKVDMNDRGSSMMWQIKTRQGTIGVISRNGAVPGKGDVLVGNFIVGYL